MSGPAFEEFHASTARPLKSYLVRLARNPALADEILQEAYYKFLRANVSDLGERERKNYLYRIATNLVHDMHRGRGETHRPLLEEVLPEPSEPATAAASDVRKVLAGLKPRERELVWLAYVEGSSHREIAAMIGVQEGSVRPMLFRARQKLIDLLAAVGYGERSAV